MSARVLALPVVALTVAFVAGGSLAGAATTVPVSGLPSLKELRAHIASARGSLPARERLTVKYTYGGVSGKRLAVRNGDDDRVETTYGPLTSARGEYRGQAWHQNENGETVLEQPDPGNATRETTTTTVGHVTTPVDALVISTLNAAGNGRKEYVDPTSYRIIRSEVVEPTDTTVTIYDDFHTSGGFTRAWHWTVRDGHREDDAEYRVSSDEVGASVPDVSIPASRRDLVEFPAGKTSVDLPVRQARGDFIVRVQVGGRGLDFALDTGASGIVIDDDVVRSLGLAHYGSISNAANAGRFASTKAVVPEIGIGELRMHDVVVSTVPHLGADGADYQGRRFTGL